MEKESAVEATEWNWKSLQKWKSEVEEGSCSVEGKSSWNISLQPAFIGNVVNLFDSGKNVVLKRDFEKKI